MIVHSSVKRVHSSHQISKTVADPSKVKNIHQVSKSRIESILSLYVIFTFFYIIQKEPTMQSSFLGFRLKALLFS